MAAVSGWWDDFFWGSLVVVELFFVALIMTVLFGLIGAGAKLSNSRVAKSIASGYTIVFRGTPEILVLLLFYFGAFCSQILDREHDVPFRSMCCSIGNNFDNIFG